MPNWGVRSDRMKTVCWIVLVVLGAFGSCIAHANDWGMIGVQRLVYSTRDIFREAFDIMTLGQDGVFPITDVRHYHTHAWRDVEDTLDFHAFNGWIENARLDVMPCAYDGGLRRYIIKSNENRHEMIVCGSCLQLVMNGFHYGFKASYRNSHTKGTISNGPLKYLISFQMDVKSKYHNQTGEFNCTSDMQPINLELINDAQDNASFKCDVRGIGAFNFLADHLDNWFLAYFNSTVLKILHHRLESEVRSVMQGANMCDYFFSS